MKKSSVKVETDFQAELKTSFEKLYPHDWFYKINDLPQKNQHRKPFDIIIRKDMILYGIETKIHTDGGSWAFKELREHQEDALLKLWPTGVVMLNVCHGDDNFIRLFWIKEFQKIRHAAKQNGRKSIPYKELRNGTVIEKNPFGLWDISELFHWRGIKNCV